MAPGWVNRRLLRVLGASPAVAEAIGLPTFLALGGRALTRPRTVFCVPGHGETHSGDRNASAVAGDDRAIALGESGWQWPRLLGGQPKAQEVPAAVRLRPIFEGGSIVEERLVVHELNVAGAQFHSQMQGRVVRKLVEQVERLDLLGS